MEQLILLDYVTQERKVVRDRHFISELTGYSMGHISRLIRKNQPVSNIRCFIINNNTTSKEITELLRSDKIKISDEIWRHSPLIDESYMVSNYGRVRKHYKNGKVRYIMFRFKSYKNRMQTECKCVGSDGVFRYYPVKRIVFSAFNSMDYEKGIPIVHKDNNPCNCSYSNLQLMSKVDCSKYGASKKKYDFVVQLDQNTMKPLAVFYSQRDVQRHLGINRTLIYQAIKYKDSKDDYRSIAGGYRWINIEDPSRLFDEYPELTLMKRKGV